LDIADLDKSRNYLGRSNPTRYRNCRRSD